MDWTVKRFGGILKPMQYLVIFSGYVLMVAMSWLLIKSAYNYITSPFLAESIRAPPIAPLIPYFPKLFNMESFFPPLYFTYFLVALIIVAVSHEFAHGIFARLNGIKVKTTGFAFLGPILGAFVEPDEKQMEKSKKFTQLGILAAGTFANVIMTVLFGLVLWGFFVVSFAPAGVNFNSYGTAVINPGEIISINDVGLNEFNFSGSQGLVKIETANKTYFASAGPLKSSLEQGIEQVVVYEDAPAVRAELRGPILEIDGVKINGIFRLKEILSEHSPGDVIEIKTLDGEEEKIYEIKLDDRDGNAYLGIGIIAPERKGLSGWFIKQVEKIKSPFIYYKPLWDGDLTWFIYNLLWWIVVINILVALFNMLPVSILDGGRFLYLTVWGLTGNEKLGKKAFAFTTWAILAVLLLMMVRWIFIFI